ncbi:peptidoglycan-associated lipoprotein Pal [bacterium]|jgi:peptidoglycan-associated lipoprotein|nr:peptidoglycan-associated lipoprotein Pal [bacterium]
MKSVRLIVLAASVFFISACTCTTRPRSIGNVPYAEAGRVLKDVHFAFDKSDLTSEAKESLKNSAKWLKSHSGVDVTLEGHCDERGTREYNLALGQRRAQSAYDYLRGLGIESDRMSMVSYGEDQPLAPGHNESAWSQNRRVHFRVEK